MPDRMKGAKQVLTIDNGCRFNVGDRVVVRDWDDMAEDFGFPADSPYIDIPGTGVCFVDRMRGLCGTEHTIERIVPRTRNGRVVGYELDLNDTPRWTWVDKMFVSVDEYNGYNAPDTAIPVEDFMRVLMA